MHKTKNKSMHIIPLDNIKTPKKSEVGICSIYFLILRCILCCHSHLRSLFPLQNNESDLPCFYFPIYEINFQNRKRERFESSLAHRKIAVDACVPTWHFRGMCDFVCGKITPPRALASPFCHAGSVKRTP